MAAHAAAGWLAVWRKLSISMAMCMYGNQLINGVCQPWLKLYRRNGEVIRRGVSVIGVMASAANGLNVSGYQYNEVMAIQ
jgi:hypothetical protein